MTRSKPLVRFFRFFLPLSLQRPRYRARLLRNNFQPQHQPLNRRRAPKDSRHSRYAFRETVSNNVANGDIVLRIVDVKFDVEIPDTVFRKP